jgi:hypothetical protein
MSYKISTLYSESSGPYPPEGLITSNLAKDQYNETKFAVDFTRNYFSSLRQTHPFHYMKPGGSNGGGGNPQESSGGDERRDVFYTPKEGVVHTPNKQLDLHGFGKKRNDREGELDAWEDDYAVVMDSKLPFILPVHSIYNYSKA